MLTRCPNCGASASLDALVAHQALRQALADVLALLPAGGLLLRYLGLFRPAQRELRPERAARLLRELLPDMQRGAITRRGREWPAAPQLWQTALDAVLDAAAKGSLQPPLQDHGYLYEVLMRLSDKQEAGQEAQREQERRSAGRPAALQARGQASHVADALAKDPALKTVYEAARNAAPMPAHVRARLNAIKKGNTP
ncbi:MAG: hypothetical protein Q4F13_06815 [Pseudomonadota bacterium]|nr:hypothetical protein [Pseudomonadota bacterium]